MGLYVGTGVGLVFFVLIGLLSGSFIGGMIGLKIATGLFGTSAGASLLPKLLVGTSMVVGAAIAAVIFIAGSSLIGWTAGHFLGVARQSSAGIQSVAGSK